MTDKQARPDLLEKLGYRPGWCGLALAVRWIVDGKRPVSPEDFDSQSERVELGDARYDEACNAVVVALRNGLLEAKGTLVIYDPPHRSHGGVDTDSVGANPVPWDKFFQSLEPEFREPDRFHTIFFRGDVPIPQSLWDSRLYDWEGNELRSPWNTRTHGCFRSVRVKTDQLAVALSDQAPSIETRSIARGTRSAKYDWESFYVEIAVRADLDGLPLTQAELVREMASWCLQKWEEEPAVSMLKEKIRRIYAHPRRRPLGK